METAKKKVDAKVEALEQKVRGLCLSLGMGHEGLILQYIDG
jgi:hypothetical protein